MKKILAALSVLFFGSFAFAQFGPNSGGSFGPVVSQSGPRPFSAVATVPSVVTGVGWLYVLNTTTLELFFEDSSGRITQITDAGQLSSDSAPPSSLAGMIDYTGSEAVTAGNYQVGRDADGTNQLHFNVPTGALFEWSVNDSPELLLTASALTPGADGGQNLGSAGLAFTNFFMDTSGVIDLASDMTITNSADRLTFADAGRGYSFDDDILLPTSGTVINWNSGDVRLSHNSNLLTFSGGNYVFDGRVRGSQGADVASANDLTLGNDGNTFEITGTTQINAITTTGWANGNVVTLIFTSTPTVKDNTAGGANTAVILLAGSVDFAATADDTLTLVLSEMGGTQAWREQSRSAN